jgi:ABC-type thiamin/hydroxymethylpyrimidine transport system permease subunit
MTDAELWIAWRLWMVVATVVIAIAATLLVIIWRTARGIRTEALRALAAAEQIRANTMPIWALSTTNDVAANILTTVEQIEQKGGALAAALESHAGAH